jgi:predicted phage tail protein
MMQEIGKAMVGFGLLLVVLGAVVILAARWGLPLRRLPGGISYRGKNVSFYFPLGTSILISVVLSAILYFISRFRR